MTDRVRHLTVTLDADCRDDALTPILEAMRMIRGVAIITDNVVTAQDQLAREAVRSEIEIALHKAIDGVFTRKNFERKFAESKDGPRPDAKPAHITDQLWVADQREDGVYLIGALDRTVILKLGRPDRGSDLLMAGYIAGLQAMKLDKTGKWSL